MAKALVILRVPTAGPAEGYQFASEWRKPMVRAAWVHRHAEKGAGRGKREGALINGALLPVFGGGGGRWFWGVFEEFFGCCVASATL